MVAVLAIHYSLMVSAKSPALKILDKRMGFVCQSIVKMVMSKSMENVFLNAGNMNIMIALLEDACALSNIILSVENVNLVERMNILVTKREFANHTAQETATITQPMENAIASLDTI